MKLIRKIKNLFALRPLTYTEKGGVIRDIGISLCASGIVAGIQKEGVVNAVVLIIIGLYGIYKGEQMKGGGL